jgi:lipopolysaccharide export LptBFGC system permease protein LptF
VYFVRRGPSQTRYSVRQLEEELHERIVLSCAPLVFALAGAAIGVLARRRSLVTSFLLAFVGVGVPYYGMFMVGRALSVSIGLPAPLAFWPANVITGAVGLLGLRRAVRG